MSGTVSGKRLRSALVVNLPWERQEKPAVTHALKSIGCEEVVQIPNSPEGWEELKKKFCVQHDFTMILFHASGTEVDDMVERFLKQEVPYSAPRFPRKPITKFQARFAAFKMIFSEALKRVMRGF